MRVDKLFARLERRIGRYAPEGIILWIVALSGVLHLLVYARPDLAHLLWLDPRAVLDGEFWRAFTFLFAPTGPVTLTGLFWTAFYLWFLHTMGTSLEAQWGAFRFDLFFFLGAIGTLLIAFVVGPVQGTWVATALLLAFAVEFPDYEILLIVLPVRVKWIGLLSGGWMLLELIAGGVQTRAAIAVALGDFLLFSGPALLARARGAARVRPQSVASNFGPPQKRAHVCSKCGRSDKDDPTLEFRVCDCQEKCHGKLTEYCIDHARNH